MPRPRNTEERRKQITLGLMGVMAKKGYDGASVADIARAAHLTPGLVHYHFEDKLQILVELAAHLSAESLSELRAHLARSGGGVDAVIDFYLGLGASAKPAVLACWIALSGEALRHPAVREVFEATLAELRKVVLEQMGARSSLSPGEAKSAAAALVATLQGYFVVAGTARALIPRGSAARTVKQMMRGLLGAKR